VFSGGLLGTIAFRGCLIALTTLAVFTATYRAAANLEAVRSGVFAGAYRNLQ
jgi:Ca2+-transporting ATPase